MTNLLAITVPQVEQLRSELRSYRNREKGIALMHTRLTEFKRLFAQKLPCDNMISLLEEDL